MVVVGLGVASMFAPLTFIFVIAAVGALAVVIARPHFGLALLVPALFFEADIYSLTLPFGRLRFYHVLVVALFVRVLIDLLRGARAWRKTPLDLPLLLYLILNWATVALAPDPSIAIKIAALISLLALLYWTVTQLVTTSKHFLLQAELLLLASLGVALFGLFQIFAVWLASHIDLTLWSGPIIHGDVLPYGRPYGTFVEPDWFGTTMAAAFVATTLLSFTKAFKTKQVELTLVSLVLLIATVLSGVRGGWLAVLISLPVMLLIHRYRLKLLDTKLLGSLAVLVGIVATLTLAFTPSVREALIDRTTTLVSADTLYDEPRFLIMQDGWELFLEAPWLGRGPGAYTTLGTIPYVTQLSALLYGIENFQTNAILTVLIDTGLIGLLVVVMLGVRFVKTTWRGLRQPPKSSKEAEIQAVLFCLAGAALTLLLAYQVSTGVWLGLTWYLGSLIISGSLLRSSIKKNHAA
ncbi:MAG: O-antigen ligase family protein [bacterium]|nr:O-antigen ligase family protein [bacterium]